MLSYDFKSTVFLSIWKNVSFIKIKSGFLIFIFSANKINIEEKRIETIKTWLKLKILQDIQVFIGLSQLL